jgi:hypothetical protein
MARDKVLPIPLELERLAVVLANQITQSRLSKPDPDAKLGSELPFELLRGSIVQCAIKVGCRPGCRRSRLVARRFVGFGIWRKRGMEERWGGGIDRAREEHEPFGVYVSRKSAQVMSSYQSRAND